ncbi:hypothetical protein GCM10010124_18450 [Pilimelia terevasa]|uniref:Uncharacterized protein n=1 Tax=Pilimelia terevasa TaxID=53372 RepID=A0A8J3BPD2_9ACTN|nr:hypothetical protein [Pilimelia terevasa]GGK26136.1 hypothetical protein GCM10010124_18450 [Pilimelia terevasa]
MRTRPAAGVSAVLLLFSLLVVAAPAAASDGGCRPGEGNSGRITGIGSRVLDSGAEVLAVAGWVRYCHPSAEHSAVARTAFATHGFRDGRWTGASHKAQGPWYPVEEQFVRRFSRAVGTMSNPVTPMGGRLHCLYANFVALDCWAIEVRQLPVAGPDGWPRHSLKVFGRVPVVVALTKPGTDSPGDSFCGTCW